MEPVEVDTLDIRALKFLASGRIKGFNILSKSELLAGLQGFDIPPSEVLEAIANAEEAKAKSAEAKRRKRGKGADE